MNFPTWARNVIAAFIYGAVNVITVVVVDPIAFNFGAQWKKTLAMALVAGRPSLQSQPIQHRGKVIVRLINLTRIAIFVAVALLATAVAPAQDRQVEISATIPVKRALLTQEIVLGGRVYLPVSDRVTTVADLNFQDAAQLFLQPTDQITAGGEAWVFLTGAENKARPFVFGGIAQTFFVGAPVEGISSTQGASGFGVVVKKGDFVAIPIFRFNTDDLQADRTVLGKNFAFEARLFVPLGKSFNLNLAPFVAREVLPANLLDPGYSTRYGIKLGFARKF